MRRLPLPREGSSAPHRGTVGEGEGGREDAPAPATARGEQAATGGGPRGGKGDEAIAEGRKQGGAATLGEGAPPAGGQGDG
jgi:hypothetical protein